MAGLDLAAQEVYPEIRVRPADLRGIIAPAMVTLGKNIDLIDMTCPEGLLELPFGKPGAYFRNQLGGMKIEMDLSRWFYSHGVRRPLYTTGGFHINCKR
jgi:hypothetical protein